MGIPADASPARAAIGRRSFLRLSLGSVAAVTLAGCGLLGSRDDLNTVGTITFDEPLSIPPLLEATSAGGHRVYELVTRSGRSVILDGTETPTWGINGPFLGPTLRAHRGETIRIDVRNELDEATTLHWHGMHLPASADGGPHQTISPGGSWSPTWTVDQPAATLWYHPHPHGESERHTYRGLAGMFILTDDVEAGLDLPRDYGVDDIPVIVQDKTFDSRGRFADGDDQYVGSLGDTVLVNGTANAFFEVTAEHTRLRLLNASTARSYAFGFSDGRDFALIATDGGLLEAPVELSSIVLTPGERAEIVVTMSDTDDTVTLRSYPQDLGVSGGRARGAGADDELDILLLTTATDLAPRPRIPSQLAQLDDISPTDDTATRTFELGNNRINGQQMDMARIDEVIPVGTTEVWEVVNTHSQPHNFHIHDVQFRVVSIDGQSPPPELRGRKDTVYTPPGSRIRLTMRFDDYADPETPYMYHCHLLRHEDQGMMGQFVVVEPGQRPAELSHHG